jgi:hypothetical protein
MVPDFLTSDEGSLIKVGALVRGRDRIGRQGTKGQALFYSNLLS